MPPTQLGQIMVSSRMNKSPSFAETSQSEPHILHAQPHSATPTVNQHKFVRR
jgi:hypothetical protein